MKIDRNNLVYSMSRENKAVAAVDPGSKLIFETCDCFEDQIKSEEMTLEKLDWERINPATGPVFINGAKPGDTLEIIIEDIAVSGHATMVSGPGMGLADEHLINNKIKIFEVKDNFLHFNEKIKLKIDPMIGVIGTAPAENPISNGTPGFHGGNMDTKVIKKGAIVYLPVEIEGGLLAMGDLHAIMGDGEISVCGGEIAGEVSVTINLISGRPFPLPFITDETSIYTVFSAEKLDEAAVGAAKAMTSLLESKGMDSHSAICLLSLAGNLQVSQIVDPLKTARFELSREIYEKI